MCSAGATIAEMGIHACTDPARAICPVPITNAIGFWLLAALLAATGLALVLRGPRQSTA
jgi:hypothetical protein